MKGAVTVTMLFVGMMMASLCTANDSSSKGGDAYGLLMLTT
jgi:hypothetical protein